MAKQSLTAELYYGGVWNTVPVYTRNPVKIARERPGSEPSPFTAALTLQGFINPKSPRSPLYGLAGQNTPIRLKLSASTRFYGEVSSWDPRRTKEYDAATGRGDAWTEIVASGILRRLGQGTDPLRTPATRAMIGDTVGDFRAAAHWSMEDESGATQFASSLSGQPAATFTGDVVPSTYSGFAGSLPLPLLNAGGAISAVMPTHTATGVWQLQHTFFLPSSASADADLVTVRMAPGSGTVAKYVLSYVHSGPALRVTSYNAAGAIMDQDDRFDWSLDTKYFANWTDYIDSGSSSHLMRFSFSDATGTQVFTISTVPDGFGLGANGAIRDVTASASAAVAGWSFGQLGYYTDPNVINVSNFGPNARAAFGYAGELAHERLARLCQEEGIPITITATESQAMGVQPRETLTALFGEAETTDDGLLYEPRDAYGLIYESGRERYNRPVALVLDYAANEVASPLDLVIDDLASRNDVTVSRRDGASARAVLETGRLSVQEPPDGIGRYTTKVDVNTETDDVLPDHAWWHLSKGTVEGARYDQVTVDLDAKPALVADVEAVDIGDIIALDNLPEDEATGRVLLMVIGYTETIGSHRRVITFTCVPASPYYVGVWTSDSPSDGESRWGANDSYLAEDLTTVETSALVDPGTDTWITGTTVSDPVRFPLRVDIGGLTYSCTAIGSAVRDAFAGSSASGWGTSDSGQVWTVGAGTASLFAETSGVGRISVSALNTEHHIAIDAGYARRQRVRVWQTLPVTPTGAAINWGCLLRRADASNFYWIDVQVGTSGSLTLRVLSKIAGVNAQLATALSATVHSTSVARILTAEIDDDNVIRVKVHATGATEPDWELVYQGSSTDLQTGTAVGCIARLMTSNSNATPVQFAFDNFEVIHPYEFTLTRLPDDKTHESGDQVWITDTFRWGI